MELEAGLREPVLPNDEDTVSIKIDEISWKEEKNRRRKRKHYSPPTHRTQRCNKKVPLLPTPPPQYNNAAQMSTNMTLRTMMTRNIEALKYQCSTVLSTEDYMTFIFENKNIQEQFHRYINVLMANRDDGQKYATLEREIGQCKLLMERIRTLPRPKQTFLLADFNNETFIAPCSKDEYIYKYCVDNYFHLPPSTETLLQPPRHPGSIQQHQCSEYVKLIQQQHVIQEISSFKFQNIVEEEQHLKDLHLYNADYL